jgi:hypothetical protein
MLFGSFTNSENIIEIPPDVISIRFKHNLQLVVGSYQDRSSNTLVTYLKDPRDNSIYETRIYERTVKVRSRKLNPYYFYTEIRAYDVYKALDGNNLARVKFVDGEIPFYAELNAIIFNRKHQKVFSATEDLIIYLMQGGIRKLSKERCLFFNPGKVLSLYINDHLITFQSSSLPVLQQDSVLVDSIVLDNFEVTNKVIEQLKNVPTVEEATKYLRRQLSFHTL